MDQAMTLFLGLWAVAAPGERRSPIVEAAEKAGPAVVNISAEVQDTQRNPFRGADPFEDFWRDFFEGSRRRGPSRSQSLGSGVIIDGRGLVLTNEHVIARASRITITLQDRRVFDVDVIGADPQFDVAVLKVRGKNALPVLDLGTSSDLMPGETVVAIGNPFGLSNSVTTGVVSALHRSVQAGDRLYEDFVQTDAAINPGNSGGALLNIEGKLIGINTAIYQSANGIGFAIPIDKALAVVEEVLKYGEVREVFLGLAVDRRSRGGAAVSTVYEGTPAAAAGLREGDVIVDVGGAAIESSQAYLKAERGLVPGQRVSLRVERNGRAIEVEVVAKELDRGKWAELGRSRLGLDAKDTNKGLVITSVAQGSDAKRVGIRAGDLLVSVAGRRVETRKDLLAVCAQIHDAEAVSVIIGRQGRGYYVTLRLR